MINYNLDFTSVEGFSNVLQSLLRKLNLTSLRQNNFDNKESIYLFIFIENAFNLIKTNPQNIISHISNQFGTNYPFIEQILQSGFIQKLANQISRQLAPNENYGFCGSNNNCSIY